MKKGQPSDLLSFFGEGIFCFLWGVTKNYIMYWGGVYDVYYSTCTKINVNKHDFFLISFLCKMQEGIDSTRHFIIIKKKKSELFCIIRLSL